MPGVGDTRFAPLVDGAEYVPHLYGAFTLEGAIYESVLHDVDWTAPRPSVETTLVEAFEVSIVRLRRRVRLVDLTAPGLHRLRLQRADLIDTTPAGYPLTREWARALREAGPPDGLIWTARQDDRCQALVLYGERLPLGTPPRESRVALVEGPFPLALPPMRDLVEEICRTADVTILD